jgi:hypothetical protein
MASTPEGEGQRTRQRPTATNQQHAVQAESPNQVFVTRSYAISQSQESAVVIGMSDYNRLIERLDGCKPGSWADLWLTVAGAVAALGVSALVTALTLSPISAATLDVLWVLTATSGAMFCLCLMAYFTQRRIYEKEIGELKKDLAIHLPGATSLPGIG